MNSHKGQFWFIPTLDTKILREKSQVKGLLPILPNVNIHHNLQFTITIYLVQL